MAIEAIIFLAVIFGIVGGLILEKLRSQIDAADQRKLDMTAPALMFGNRRVPAVQKADGVDKLRSVSDARFSTKRLISDNEALVLAEIEAIIAEIGQPWRVMAQVGLRQIIASNNADANAAIDSQQVALLIVGPDRAPIAAVDYQPLGQVRSEDAVRDAVKREALRRAGIAYIEVRASDGPGDLRDDIAGLVVRRRALVDGPGVAEPPGAADVPAAGAPPAEDPAAADQPAAATKPPPRKPRGKPASGVKP